MESEKEANLQRTIDSSKQVLELQARRQEDKQQSVELIDTLHGKVQTLQSENTTKADVEGKSKHDSYAYFVTKFAQKFPRYFFTYFKRLFASSHITLGSKTFFSLNKSF